MAEQEVIKHTKKVYKVWNSKQHSFVSKLKEFFIEILIIIFAVTVSIWFHNLSEKRHDRKEVKNYLIGLQTDLGKDVTEMQSDTMSFGMQRNYLQYLSEVEKTTILDSNKINEYSWTLYNTTALVPNNSRFETLKYSGLMGKIENKILLDEILNLYEEKIPEVVQLGKNASNFKNENLGKILDEERYSKKNRFEVINNISKNNPNFNYYLTRCIDNCNNVIHNYKDLFNQYKKVDSLITVELKKL